MRAIGYVRVSTEEQATNGAGLEAQRVAIAVEAARRGWELVEVIEDAGFSGRDLNRPGIQRGLTMLRAGNVDVLLVARLDRLSRSLRDVAELMDEARRPRRQGRRRLEGWRLVPLDMGELDTTTATGEALAGMVGVFAQLERRMIAERTRVALQAKRAAGVRLGRPPVLSDAVRRRILRARRAGATFRKIAATLNRAGTPTAHGGKAWHASTVRAVLRVGT